MNPSVPDGISGERRKVGLLPETGGFSDRLQNSLIPMAISRSHSSALGVGVPGTRVG